MELGSRRIGNACSGFRNEVAARAAGYGDGRAAGIVHSGLGSVGIWVDDLGAGIICSLSGSSRFDSASIVEVAILAWRPSPRSSTAP
jgi:hypothetical protein